MEKLIKEAVNQLETLLGTELIKLDSLENQLMLIDQMILKLEKYRDRITYRVVDVSSPPNNSLEDATILDTNPPAADTIQLFNILVTPKSAEQEYERHPDDDLIETKTYVTTIEENSETVSVDVKDAASLECKDNDKLHKNIIVSERFEDKKDDENVSVEESLIFVNEENSGEEHFDEESRIQQDSHIQLTNGEEKINWLMYYQRIESGFVCKICEKTLKGSSQMKEHVRDIHGIGGSFIQCQLKDCGYSTLSGSQFRAHKSWHANNAALTCPLCKKEYLGGTKGLRNHMKIHSKRRDYNCESCNKSFINLSRLNFHIQNVHGDQAYLCEFCNHQFKSKANFMRHQLTHSSEKPFTCHHCPFSTTGSTSLTSHVRNVHKEFDFTAGKANKIKKKVDRIKTMPSNNITLNIQTVVNKHKNITNGQKNKESLLL